LVGLGVFVGFREYLFVVISVTGVRDISANVGVADSTTVIESVIEGMGVEGMGVSVSVGSGVILVAKTGTMDVINIVRKPRNKIRIEYLVIFIIRFMLVNI